VPVCLGGVLFFTLYFTPSASVYMYTTLSYGHTQQRVKTAAVLQLSPPFGTVLIIAVLVVILRPVVVRNSFDSMPSAMMMIGSSTIAAPKEPIIIGRGHWGGKRRLQIAR